MDVGYPWEGEEEEWAQEPLGTEETLGTLGTEDTAGSGHFPWEE